MDTTKLQSLFDMTGRVVIVTGGSRGIGRSLAEGYAAAGAKVVVASRKQEAVDETAAHLRDELLVEREIGLPQQVAEVVVDEALARRARHSGSSV